MPQDGTGDGRTGKMRRARERFAAVPPLIRVLSPDAGVYSESMDAQRLDPNYPHPSSPQAKRRMQACGQKNTAPELALRSLLHGMGLRYRIDCRLIPGLRRKADVSFPRLKVAVFVNGCFWHGCPKHATWPKANGEYWRRKILRNRERDKDTDRRLAEEGWLVIRVWEHEAPVQAANRIARAVRRRTALPRLS